MSTPKYTVLSSPLKYTSGFKGRGCIYTYCTCALLYIPCIWGYSFGDLQNGGVHFGGGDVGGDVAEVMEMVQHDVGEMSTSK